MSRERTKGILIGMVIMLVFTMGTSTSWAKDVRENILVSYSNIKIMVNGVKLDPRDGNGQPVEPFIYNGTTYLPVRAVAESVGMEVNWDGTTQTVLLNERGYNQNFNQNDSQDFISYNNSRYGYQVQYPRYWGTAVESDSGDGSVLFDNSIIGVRVFASYSLMVFDEDLDTYAREYYPNSIKHNTVVPGAERAMLLICDYGNGSYEEVLLAVKNESIYTFSISAEAYKGIENMDSATSKIFLEAQDAMESLRIN